MILKVLIIISLLILVFLFLTFPRIRKSRLDDFKKYKYAHRGFHNNKKDTAENSMKAFKEAVENKYAIELDVQLSKDKKLLVFHDFDLNRSNKMDVKIKDMTYKEILDLNIFNTNSHIPLFKEVLDRVDKKVPILVEIKSESLKVEEICLKTCEILDTYNGDFLIESFNPLVLNWFKKNRPEIIRGQLSRNFKNERSGLLYILLSLLMTNFLARPDFIAYDFKHVRNYLKFYKFIYKIPFFAYTIENKKDLNKAKTFFDTFIFNSLD